MKNAKRLRCPKKSRGWGQLERIVVCRAHVLRVSLYLSNMEVKASPKPSQTRCSLCSFVSVLTSRIAGYVIRMSGGVGGVLSDGCPYPYRQIFHRCVFYGFLFYNTSQ
ncbi:MAG: hypothetical protein LWX02_06325 [Deltaproteobacteria bacterium]|nr:hypothetical protein [Deltaproteobacteria bacterium]